jgi:hypothetical protein
LRRREISQGSACQQVEADPNLGSLGVMERNTNVTDGSTLSSSWK